MGAIWVFHRGALGDSILLWPVLRALARRAPSVVLVSEASKGALASRVLGITSLDAEQERFNALWRAECAPEPASGVDEVLALVSSSPAASIWITNLGRMFPGARVRRFDERGNRVEPRELARERDDRPPIINPAGPTLLHIGAGGESKRWPLDRWLALASSLSQPGVHVELIAGEVEQERVSARDRQAFLSAGGRFIESLNDLATAIERARLFIAGDTGPTHLAAALRIPTLALFGPTDPALWAPQGPACEVIAPDTRVLDMGWLDVDSVHDRARTMLERSACDRSM
jgi:ADP-heptose:LPS heptosyltransferase